jgi:recombination protein RecA
MGRKKEEAPAVANPNEPRTAKVLVGDTVAAIRKKFGKNMLVTASDERVRTAHRIPSGIFQLDWALGGGWQAGRFNTVYGMKSVAKTSVMCKTVAEAQKLCALCFSPKTDSGKCTCGSFRETVCAFIDIEGTFDAAWAKRLGVDTDKLLYSRPEYAEQSLDIFEALLREGDVDHIILDSIAFLTPLAEIQESVSKETMAVQARIMGKGIRKLVSALTHIKNEEGRMPTIFFTNQVRLKTGLVFGSPETQPGGLASQFANTSEVRLRAGKVEMDEATGKPRHAIINFKVEKNKSSVPMMEGEFRLILADTETKKIGDVYEEDVMVELGQKFGLVEGAGASWSCLGETYPGKSPIERRLLTDPAFYAIYKDALMKILLAV